jgi:hypothetical protein
MEQSKYSNNPDINNSSNFVDENNMFLHRNWDWEPDGDSGKGDALWRTGIAYMVYEDIALLRGIVSCLKYVDGYWQAYRYPEEWSKKTVSRDQIVSALVGLKEKKFDISNDIASEFKWKLSEKYNQTIDFHLWLRALGGNPLWVNTFYLVSTIMILFIIPWNRFWRWVGNFKTKTQEEFRSLSSKDLSWIRRLASKLSFPTYAFYLWCWQVYVLPDNWLREVLQKLMLMECERSNHVLRIILGAEITEEEKWKIRNYKSMRDFRWNRRLNDSTNNGLRIAKYSETWYNDLDRDLLVYLYNKHLT